MNSMMEWCGSKDHKIRELELAVRMERPGILADHQIERRMQLEDGDPMRLRIEPFVGKSVREVEYEREGSLVSPVGKRKVISYGLTSYGYDVRLGEDFYVFVNTFGGTINPKELNPKCFVKQHVPFGEELIIPPNSFVLAYSMETYRIPRDCIVRITGKSTYARSAQVVPVTPLEPEWEGQITIEISNTAPCPCIIYPGEGIMQLQFEKASEVCQTSYKDRDGKYLFQKGIVLPTV